MARKKEDNAQEGVVNEAVETNEQTPSVTEEATKEPLAEEPKQENTPSEQILRIMKLYPQYEEMWITPNGFVHPKNAPKYCTKGATLYKNKFYKTK